MHIFPIYCGKRLERECFLFTRCLKIYFLTAMSSWMCAVKHCKSHRQLTKRENSSIMFHRFPKNAVVRKIWLRFCGDKSIDADKCVICSQHFKAEDYSENMQARLMYGKSLRKLTAGGRYIIRIPIRISFLLKSLLLKLKLFLQFSVQPLNARHRQKGFRD